MRDELVRFENVEVISNDGAGLVCVVNGRRVSVPKDRIPIDDRAVRRPGDRGDLVITKAAAICLHLVSE